MPTTLVRQQGGLVGAACDEFELLAILAHGHFDMTAVHQFAE